MKKTGVGSTLQCSLGSCDEHIFSLPCHNKILNLNCPRYETIQDRDDDTIGKMREKTRKATKG